MKSNKERKGTERKKSKKIETDDTDGYRKSPKQEQVRVTRHTREKAGQKKKKTKPKKNPILLTFREIFQTKKRSAQESEWEQSEKRHIDTETGRTHRDTKTKLKRKLRDEDKKEIHRQ